jgi:hypothetical protein
MKVREYFILKCLKNSQMNLSCFDQKRKHLENRFLINTFNLNAFFSFPLNRNRQNSIYSFSVDPS